MNRHQFLGSTDLGISSSLLINYNVPTKIPDGIKLNRIKHQNDLILIELGTLLTSDECDEILSNIRQQTFEQMSKKYDVRKRNSSRLVVMDDRLGRTLWRRLKFSNKLTKLVRHTKPLGFNVQGQWTMSGVNPAMRLNKYNHGDYFGLHKDAQYAPSGDERSLLSLLIYLNDNYEKGETKFYFPKQSSKSDVKGLTIAEEMEAYGGLENGFECITLKPKKGFAVLFTHNLLHEATPPEILNPLVQTERLVLRTDVLVKRKEKPLGFAICPEEKEDYLACLNFFREAQQNELESYNDSNMTVDKTVKTGELYERSLSIRYCYPRLLESKLKQTAMNKVEEKSLIHQLPSELWLHIFKHLHEQDIQHLIFAFPQFQMLKIVWEAQETKAFIVDPARPKFIPTIQTQYGSQTLFRFSNSDFFYQHIDGCCRVAAVYAFFLLGHGKGSTMYIVRYDRNTQEVCEVHMERVLADAFYNRNCYGSLYRVEQKEKERRQPKVDFAHSVDRTYLTNRHQSQFIGQDLLSCIHLTIDDSDSLNLEASDDENRSYRSRLLYYQRQHAWADDKNYLVNQDFRSQDFDHVKDTALSYREHLLKQTEQDSGTSLFRMISSKDPFMEPACHCGLGGTYRFERVRGLLRFYNHLIFDFDTHQLTVEQLSNKALSDSVLYDYTYILEDLVSKDSQISFYRVNIEQLAKKTKGFNHASCQCNYPHVKVDQFSFLDYTQLSYVNLAVTKRSDDVFVLATYGGIAAF
ncbi:unnamed protein product [Rotaria sp. Silwood1]|nr:unnamed protein product [Rotaria sp. Silwood1]